VQACKAASRWELAQAAKERSDGAWAAVAEASGVAAANARAEEQIREAARKAASADALPQSIQPSSADAVGPVAAAAATAEDADKARRKLLKALRQIEELKQRLADGDGLEETQRLKIGREAALRAELRELDERTGGAVAHDEEELQEQEAVPREKRKKVKKMES